MPSDSHPDRRQISYGAILPVEPDRAFRFVSQQSNWPTFFESVRSAEALPDWGNPADGVA